MPMYRTVSPLSRTIVSPSTTPVTRAQVQSIDVPLGTVGNAASVGVGSQVGAGLVTGTGKSAAGVLQAAVGQMGGGSDSSASGFAGLDHLPVAAPTRHVVVRHMQIPIAMPSSASGVFTVRNWCSQSRRWQDLRVLSVDNRLVHSTLSARRSRKTGFGTRSLVGCRRSQ